MNLASKRKKKEAFSTLYFKYHIYLSIVRVFFNAKTRGLHFTGNSLEDAKNQAFSKTKVRYLNLCIRYFYSKFFLIILG